MNKVVLIHCFLLFFYRICKSSREIFHALNSEGVRVCVCVEGGGGRFYVSVTTFVPDAIRS